MRHAAIFAAAALSQSAAAQVYDWTGLDAAAALAGQDNWRPASLPGTTLVSHRVVAPGADAVERDAISAIGPFQSWDARKNDAAFSMSAAMASTTPVIDANIVVPAAPVLAFAELQLWHDLNANGTFDVPTEAAFTFSIASRNGGSELTAAIQRQGFAAVAASAEITGLSPFSGEETQLITVRMEIDPDGNAGDGAARLLIRDNRGTDAAFVEVFAGVPLGLQDAPPLSRIDGFSIRTGDPDGRAGFAAVRFTGVACQPADLAAPFGVLSQTDIDEFVRRFFMRHESVAALAEPTEIVSYNDAAAFSVMYREGCDQ